MRNSLRLWLIGVFAACGTTAAPTSALFAQEGWDVTLPRGETREIDFTTTEGTWMSVDLSPDGSWLVFDLLGHVYRLSTRGGAGRAAHARQRNRTQLPSEDLSRRRCDRLHL